MNMVYIMFNINSNSHTIFIKTVRCKLITIINTNFLNLIIWKWALSWINWANDITNVWLRVDNKETCDHLLDASIKIMKYLNDSHGECISPQISSYIHSKNEMSRFPIFLGDGLIINFLWKHIVPKKSLDRRILWLFNGCPHEISNIFFVW